MPGPALPDAWDAGSAAVIEAAGAGALATTSAGLTRSLGAAADRLDRDRTPAAARALVRRAARELLGRGPTGATTGS
ncbi:isocitrate lyase/phosphoenolpyruvate mutase family protein [Streptomyces murinus]|uniref:isocitrate lyase/phosphoenolpyruvate mutase family protein n=1 Tax=Streptomyces murinus TaxID=33900 RepID=UPI0036EB7B6D